MSVLNYFKKENSDEEKKSSQKKIVTEGADVKTEKPMTSVNASKSELADLLLNAPHISEKGTLLQENNQYIFRVSRRANKSEIKKAVESLYKVKVISVNIINQPPQPKSLRGRSGFRSGYKKAIVSLKKGEQIEIVT